MQHAAVAPVTQTARVWENSWVAEPYFPFPLVDLITETKPRGKDARLMFTQISLAYINS
jgi:hypothetical protein